MTIGAHLSNEVRAEGERIRHYFGKALGMEFPLPTNNQEPISKFSNMNLWDMSTILEGLSAFSIPEVQELLDIMYARFEETAQSPYLIMIMIRAELALGLNQPV
jgi:hypothetical protein